MTRSHLSLSALALAAATTACAWASAQSPRLPSPAALDAEVSQAMAATGAKGMAIAVIDGDRVVSVKSYGLRNAKREPLLPDTVMYGASLTKAVFAWTVMQLVDEGKLDLDASIATYLPKPLPAYDTPDVEDKYARWGDLAGDERWRKLTPRILLSHGPGFANFGFLEPDGKLRIHFEPGSRYAYSGDGLILLQFVIEKGLGLDIGEEMKRRVFDRFGMTRTSMMWRADFAQNLADGWDDKGQPHPHDERSTPRASGSMDTTISDMAKFAAAYISGAGLSLAARAELTRPQRPITTATQFPTLQGELPVAKRRKDLAAGLGVIVFDGPQGHAFEKGGHDDITGNTLHCVEATRRCVLILSNDVRAESAFRRLAGFVLGETGVPWRFLYGDMQFW
jgi:CubicO group peptidase (beta-lactamase class C family)